MGMKLEVFRAAMRVAFLWGLVTVLGLLIRQEEASLLFTIGTILAVAGAMLGWGDLDEYRK